MSHQKSEILSRRAYSVPEIAEQLGKHPSAVYRWIRNGELSPIAASGEIVIASEELKRFLSAKREVKA